MSDRGDEPLSGYSVSTGRAVPADRPTTESALPPAPYHDVERPVSGTYRPRDFDSTYKAFIAAYGSAGEDNEGFEAEKSNTFELRTARAIGLGRFGQQGKG